MAPLTLGLGAVPGGDFIVDEAFLEFINGVLTESAANTFTELEIATPASRTALSAMLIWLIEFDMTTPDIEDAQTNVTNIQLTRDTTTGLNNLEDDDLLARWSISVAAGAIQGSLSEYLVASGLDPRPRVFKFDPPILYPRSSVWLGIQGTGNVNVKTGRCRVGYTLEKVSQQAFIAALVD